MISTVNPLTVAMTAAPDLNTALAGAVTIGLIVLLAQRELAAAATPALRQHVRTLTVVIAPFLVMFLAIVAARFVPIVWPA